MYIILKYYIMSLMVSVPHITFGEDYVRYIESNDLITSCQKKTLVSYYRLLRRLDPPTNSNIQIQSLFNYIQSNDDMEQYSRLYMLILFFSVSNVNTRKIMNALIKSNLSDSDIVKMMIPSSIEVKASATKSEFQKCNKWNYSIQLLSKHYISTYRVDPTTIQYLDIGCGNASKTKLFHKYMNIPAQNVRCTDIRTWGPYGENKVSIPFAFEYINNGRLNYSDNSFDFITCIFTLHHIPEMDDFIREIWRVLKPGGRIMIIEHSAYTDYDKVLVRIQHLLFSAIYDNRIDYIENPDYINLFNMYEWDFIMSRHNLISTDKNIVVFDTEFKLSYDNIFYGIYTKSHQKRLKKLIK